MANVKISELPVATTVGNSDLVPIVQGGVTKQATVGAQMNAVGLWKISSGTVTSTTSFYVTGFTSDYEQFRLMLSLFRTSGTGGAGVDGQWAYNTTICSTGYYGGGNKSDYFGAVTGYGPRNNGSAMLLGGLYAQDGRSQQFFDIGGMNTTSLQPTLSGYFFDFSQSANVTVGYQCVTKTNPWNRLYVSCGTNMSGNWTLYGYNKG